MIMRKVVMVEHRELEGFEGLRRIRERVEADRSQQEAPCCYTPSREGDLYRLAYRGRLPLDLLGDQTAGESLRAV